MKPDQPAINAVPALIILQPQADGTRFDAYGLDRAECIDELRRALLQLVARQSGVTIISEVVSRQAAIVPAQREPAAAPASNGTKPKTKPYMKGPRGQRGV